jgi:hypothetical protein
MNFTISRESLINIVKILQRSKIATSITTIRMLKKITLIAVAVTLLSACQSELKDNQNGSPIVSEKGITINNLQPNSKVTSPLTITGTAAGWYFEATFPVKIVDDKDNLIVQSYATAQSDWMTIEPVEFETTLVFDPGATTEGKIVFEKANPSDLPEYAASFEIPVKF